MEDAGGWARSLWGHCEVDKSIFERLRTECSMLGGGEPGVSIALSQGGGSPLDYPPL